MIEVFVAAALLGSAHLQDGIVVTSGRDLPARNQRVISKGECHGVPVAVAIDHVAGAVEVRIGDRRRAVTGDIFTLATGPGGRYVARTFILCREPEGGLDVHLLFADPRNGTLTWTQQGFTLDNDLTVLSVGQPRNLDSEEAVRSFH